MKALPFVSAATLLFSLSTQSVKAQDAAANEANNPLTPKVTINLQDYYTPSFYGLPKTDANSFLLRGIIPMKLGGLPQLFRFTLPVSTVPTFDGHRSGVGDLTLMDLFVIPGKPITFAVGPLLVAPTASDDATGSGRWQAGAAGVAIAPQSWGLLGGIVTYQHSFAKTFGRDTQNLLTAQPIAFYNLPAQFYLRSSATWNFDFEKHSGYVPIGLGVGKVIPISDKITANTYIEPQYTVYHYGKGTPHWQIFGGINFQFALGNSSAALPQASPVD